MNFLAHLHLAAHTRSSLTGNLLGDFIKGPLPTALAAHFDEGIWLHRKIDAFTDSHPEHKAAVTCFEAPWRRFGGIVVDMLYDHWLSQHWGRFSTEPCPTFYRRATANYWRITRICRTAIRSPSSGWPSRTGSPPTATGRGWGKLSTASVADCAARYRWEKRC